MTTRLRSLLKASGEYGVLACLLALHVLCFSLPGRKAKLASSNLMTNLARLESLHQLGPQTTVLAGSSITGRLLEEYFSPQLPIANLGLDGCGSLEAMQALLAQPQRPAVVMIELNTFKPGLEKAYEQVRTAFQPRRAQAAQFLPFLRIDQRPADLLYDFTRSFKQSDGQGGQIAWNDAIRITAPIWKPQTRTAAEQAAEAAYLEAARAVITRLHAEGCRMLFVLVPDALFTDPWHDRNFERALDIAAPLGLPIFDLRRATGVESLSWTDQIHLTPAAARTVAAFLETELLPQAR